MARRCPCRRTLPASSISCASSAAESPRAAAVGCANAIGAEQRDPRITELVATLREAVGVRTIGKGFDLKGALRCLRRGEILGVLLDQDARSAGVVVPFLGYAASTPYGPVKMAAKLGARVVPLFMVRRQDGQHHDLFLLPPLGEAGGKPG